MLTGQLRAKVSDDSYRLVADVQAALNLAVDPGDHGRDRDRDAQYGQSVPEGDHHGDGGEDPERGGLQVVAASVSTDRARDVPHVCLASIGVAANTRTNRCNT